MNSKISANNIGSINPVSFSPNTSPKSLHQNKIGKIKNNTEKMKTKATRYYKNRSFLNKAKTIQVKK